MENSVIEKIVEEWKKLKEAKELLDFLSSEIWLIDRGLKNSISKELIYKLKDFYNIDENE
jgi:hypothetical protein